MEIKGNKYKHYQNITLTKIFIKPFIFLFVRATVNNVKIQQT